MYLTLLFADSSPAILFPFVFSFLELSTFYGPKIDPQSALSHSHHYSVPVAQVHLETLSRYFLKLFT